MIRRRALYTCAYGIFVAASLRGQQTGFSYAYGNKTIELKPLASTIAAKVQQPVDYIAKFPWLMKYFSEVGRSRLTNEPILIKAARAPVAASIAALKAGMSTQEINSLPVFSYGKSVVVVQGELIVAFKSGSDQKASESLIARFSKTFTRQPGSRLRYIVRVPDPSRTLDWARTLNGNHTVDYAEPDFLVIQPARPASPVHFSGNAGLVPALDAAPSAGSLYPSDILFASQWGLTRIGAPVGWRSTHGANGIKIAILDNGVDVGHSDIANKVVGSWDALFESDAMNPPPTDWHGTAVAGVAAAATNNGYGISGLAADVKLIPIRMMSVMDESTDIHVNSMIANAFEKALELGADVINCSWTLDLPSKDVDAAIHSALTEGRGGLGTTVVFAAGNENGAVDYPANLSAMMNLIAVGASNESDQFKTPSSSDGETNWGSNFGKELTVVAPGVHITTTIHRGAVGAGQQPFMDNFNGTSSAAPLVSGLAALILSVEPGLTAAQVRDRIRSTADLVVKMPDNSGAMIGRINVCKALRRQDCGDSIAANPSSNP